MLRRERFSLWNLALDLGALSILQSEFLRPNALSGSSVSARQGGTIYYQYVLAIILVHIGYKTVFWQHSEIFSCKLSNSNTVFQTDIVWVSNKSRSNTVDGKEFWLVSVRCPILLKKVARQLFSDTACIPLFSETNIIMIFVWSQGSPTLWWWQIKIFICRLHFLWKRHQQNIFFFRL